MTLCTMIKKALEKCLNFSAILPYMSFSSVRRVNSKEKAIKLLYSNIKNSAVKPLQIKGESVLFPAVFSHVLACSESASATLAFSHTSSS